jgi:hypothetical protein
MGNHWIPYLRKQDRAHVRQKSRKKNSNSVRRRPRIRLKFRLVDNCCLWEDFPPRDSQGRDQTGQLGNLEIGEFRGRNKCIF